MHVIHYIDDIIQLLDSIQNKCSVIVITETWLQENNKEIYNTINFNSCHITRINTQHNYKYNIVGGVSIFIKNDLIYNKIDTYVQ